MLSVCVRSAGGASRPTYEVMAMASTKVALSRTNTAYSTYFERTNA